MRVLPLLLVVACSEASVVANSPTGDDIADGGADTDTSFDTGVEHDTDVQDTDTEMPAALGRGCDATPPSGSYTVSLQHNGSTRTAIVDLPSDYDGTRARPLVLNFHGNATDSAMQRSYSEMHTAATARGWISVHPNGLNRTWNVLPASTDVDFADALLDELNDTLCVDESRVYSAGMSQGAHLSYLIGCDLSDRIAAIGPVAGADVSIVCNPTHPVPVMHIHGTADTIVDFAGGNLYPGAEDSVADWSEHVNDCAMPPEVTATIGAVTCHTRQCDGGAPSTLCTVQGGGHTWPGAAPIPFLGSTNNDMDATEALLDFFEEHDRD